MMSSTVAVMSLVTWHLFHLAIRLHPIHSFFPFPSLPSIVCDPRNGFCQGPQWQWRYKRGREGAGNQEGLFPPFRNHVPAILKSNFCINREVQRQ